MSNTIKESPILFSTKMVEAILEGRKTQTRRIVKDIKIISRKVNGQIEYLHKRDTYTNHPKDICPYGKIGDRLWVRETWTKIGAYIYYRADFDNGTSADEIELPDGTMVDDAKWKPSIFMPKEVCRIWLRITNIRVERLQDITEEDAKREGVTLHKSIDPNRKDLTHKWRFAFCLLWESINGKGSWDENPWVWVIEFERIRMR